MLVSEAITRARNDLLDDDGTRWADAEVIRNLNAAMYACFDERAPHGRWFVKKAASLSAVSGVIDMSSYSLAGIHSVAVKYGNRVYYLKSMAEEHGDYIEVSGNKQFDVYYFEKPQSVSTTTSHPLLRKADNSALEGTWETLEEFICRRAAAMMAAKDGVIPDALKQLVAELEPAVRAKMKVPRSRELRGRGNGFTKGLRWAWREETQEIVIVRVLC